MKRDANTAGGWGWGGGGGGKQDVKKVKVDLDDEPVILSTSSFSTTDTKRAPIVQQQRYGSYNRSQANLAALARAAKFPCNKCGNKFDSKADLDKHESSEHDEGRCSKIFLLLLAFCRRCDECEDDFAWPAPDHVCYYTMYQLRRLRGDIIPAF